MAKIFSILTLLVAIGAAYLGLESNKLVQDLQTKGAAQFATLNQTKDKLTKTDAELKTTKETLATTQKDLDDSKTALVAAKESQTKAEGDLKTAQAETTKAKGDLAAIQEGIEKAFPGEGLKGIDTLTTKLSDLTNKSKELEATVAKLNNDLTAKASEVEALSGEKKSLEDKANQDRQVIRRYKDGIMVKSTRGRVLAVNSGWGFAVISIGDKQGAAANKVLIVTRGGQAIGKVKITNVEATQSVADILPGSFARNTYVQPGDEVIFTGEDKVNAEEGASSNSGSPALPTQPN
jgi:hypothetical protein